MLVYDECLEARQRGVATAGSFVNTLVIFQVCLGSPRFLCCGSPGGERERDGNSCTSHWVRMCVQIKARRDLDPEICQQQFLSTAIGNFSSHMNPLCRTSAVPLKSRFPLQRLLVRLIPGVRPSLRLVVGAPPVLLPQPLLVLLGHIPPGCAEITSVSTACRYDASGCRDLVV